MGNYKYFEWRWTSSNISYNIGRAIFVIAVQALQSNASWIWTHLTFESSLGGSKAIVRRWVCAHFPTCSHIGPEQTFANAFWFFTLISFTNWFLNVISFFYFMDSGILSEPWGGLVQCDNHMVNYCLANTKSWKCHSVCSFGTFNSKMTAMTAMHTQTENRIRVVILGIGPSKS